jgi:hypothetical protein
VSNPRNEVEPLPAASAVIDSGSVWRPAIAGMRANLLPGLVLQSFALTIVVGYFHVAEVERALDVLGALKREWGYGYSACSTAFFGGLIPFVTLWACGRIPRGREAGELAFYIAFWIWKGVEVDALYRGQVLLFGDSADATVIGTKLAVDQFLYNPLWAVPTQTVCFLWKDAGFSLSELKRHLAERTLARRSATILFSTWIVWIPAVAIIYALPAPLQIPLFNLVLCFWCLLLTFISRDTTR